jgi:putative ABC transport system substrate-binding protein
MPVVGFLFATSQAERPEITIAIRKGLAEIGYIEGQNVAFEYRTAEAQYDRLPALAAELVRRRVSVILTGASAPAALAAKAATTTIPIVFAVGNDPVKLGLVASLNRPGGNATGMSYFTQELGAKRLGLLRGMAPEAALIAVLTNQSNPGAEAGIADLQETARMIGQQIEILHASNSREINAAFATLVQKKSQALLVNPDAVFTARRVQIVTLATRHGIPAMFSSREFTDIGGLMSYGTNLSDVYRQVGAYAGRILKGTKPADLPVVQPTSFDFVINLQTALALGLDVPPNLSAQADEVIE